MTDTLTAPKWACNACGYPTSDEARRASHAARPGHNMRPCS